MIRISQKGRFLHDTLTEIPCSPDGMDDQIANKTSFTKTDSQESECRKTDLRQFTYAGRVLKELRLGARNAHSKSMWPM